MGANFKSSDLKYTYSKTTTGRDNPNFAGKPDSALFNKKEEYEVIPMLNKVLDELNALSKEDLHRLEDLVRYELPGSIRSREKVFDWLVNNF